MDVNCMQYVFIFHKIGPTDVLYSSPAQNFKTLKVFLFCFPKCSGFIKMQSYAIYL